VSTKDYWYHELIYHPSHIYTDFEGYGERLIELGQALKIICNSNYFIRNQDIAFTPSHTDETKFGL
jgi:hypothetical protein